MYIHSCSTTVCICLLAAWSNQVFTDCLYPSTAIMANLMTYHVRDSYLKTLFWFYYARYILLTLIISCYYLVPFTCRPSCLLGNITHASIFLSNSIILLGCVIFAGELFIIIVHAYNNNTLYRSSSIYTPYT